MVIKTNYLLFDLNAPEIETSSEEFLISDDLLAAAASDQKPKSVAPFLLDETLYPRDSAFEKYNLGQIFPLNMMRILSRIGRDTRQPAPTGSPYSAICNLDVVYERSRAYATGCLVSPFLVATSAHVIKSKVHANARRVEVIPARNGNYTISQFSTGFAFPQQWDPRSGNVDYDFAFIVLGDASKFAPFGTISPLEQNATQLRDQLVMVSGYPGDKGSFFQYSGEGKIKSVMDLTFQHNVDTCPGQSGAPVIRFVNGANRLIGVHSSGWSYQDGRCAQLNGSQSNFARRVDDIFLKYYNFLVARGPQL